MKPKLYLAAPLFSDAEKAFNTILDRHLSSSFEVFLPQRDNHLFADLVSAGSTIGEASQQIFSGDLSAIRDADVLLAVLDGRSVDEGVCFELGFAHALQKLCVGLQTDPRRLMPIGNNPMVDGALEREFTTVADLLEWATRFEFTN